MLLFWTSAPVKFLKCSFSGMLERLTNIMNCSLWKRFFDSLAEADTEEDVTLLIFNRNTTARLSKSDVLRVLKKANLTGRGFKKELSYETVMSPESTSHFKVSTAIIPFRTRWITFTFQTSFVVRNPISFIQIIPLFFGLFLYCCDLRGAVLIQFHICSSRVLKRWFLFFFLRNRTSITN